MKGHAHEDKSFEIFQQSYHKCRPFEQYNFQDVYNNNKMKVPCLLFVVI